jgi:hypothetical protein
MMKILQKIEVDNIFEKNEPPIILFLHLLFLYFKLEAEVEVVQVLKMEKIIVAQEVEVVDL